jgi:hypothetical protein
VLLVVAARPVGEPGGAAVTEMLGGGAPALLRPPALSDAASAELVRAAVPGAMTALCRSCHALTGGNPFFLRERRSSAVPATTGSPAVAAATTASVARDGTAPAAKRARPAVTKEPI